MHPTSRIHRLSKREERHFLQWYVVNGKLHMFLKATLNKLIETHTPTDHYICVCVYTHTHIHRCINCNKKQTNRNKKMNCIGAIKCCVLPDCALAPSLTYYSKFFSLTNITSLRSSITSPVELWSASHLGPHPDIVWRII